MEKVENISFNIYADTPEDAEELKKAITDFIDWFGKRGYKVQARSITKAINGWESNMVVRNQIIKFITNGR